jgi:hypothetical protein
MVNAYLQCSGPPAKGLRFNEIMCSLPMPHDACLPHCALCVLCKGRAGNFVLLKATQWVAAARP